MTETRIQWNKAGETAGVILFAALDYLILFLIIAMTGNAWVYDTKTEITQNLMFGWLQRLVFTQAVLYAAVYRRLWISKERYIRLLIGAAAILTFQHFNTVNRADFRTRYMILLLWIVLWIGTHKDKTVLWKRFVNIFAVVAAASLIWYLLGPVLHVLPVTYETPRVWGTWEPPVIKNYQYLFYESHFSKIFGLKIWRNTAFFTEGPMYNMGLCTALIAEMFMEEKPKRWKLILFSVTILSTISTTGMICLAAAWFIRLAQTNKKVGTVVKKYLPVALAILAAVMVGLLLLKLYTSAAGKGSTRIRLRHLIACWKAFKNHKFTGCGWLNAEAVWQYTFMKKGPSIGLMYFVSSGGILLSSLILVPVIQDIREAFTEKKYNLIFFEGLFIMLFFFTQICNTPLLWFFLAYIHTADHFGDAGEESEESPAEEEKSPAEKEKSPAEGREHRGRKIE